MAARFKGRDGGPAVAHPGALTSKRLGPIWIVPSFVNVPRILSEDPPSRRDGSRLSLPELVTPPATELAPASIKVSLPEFVIAATVPKLVVTRGLPVLITASLFRPGRPTLQSPGVSQLAVPSVQVSFAMARAQHYVNDRREPRGRAHPRIGVCVRPICCDYRTVAPGSLASNGLSARWWARRVACHRKLHRTGAGYGERGRRRSFPSRTDQYLCTVIAIMTRWRRWDRPF
jgi:hypothetical protein